MIGKLDIVSVFLTHLISHLGEILPLDVEHDGGLSFIFIEIARHLNWALLLTFLKCIISQNVNIGTLNDTKNGFVESQGILWIDFRFITIVMSSDESVEEFQLLLVCVAQPISDLGELRPDGTFLVPVQSFDLHVTLVAQVFYDFIDSLVIDGFHVASICFGEHFRVDEGDFVVVDTVLDEVLSDGLLFFVFASTLLWRDPVNPSGFSGWQNLLFSLILLRMLWSIAHFLFGFFGVSLVEFKLCCLLGKQVEHLLPECELLRGELCDELSEALHDIFPTCELVVVIYFHLMRNRDLG